MKSCSREFARIFRVDGEKATAYLTEGKEALVQAHNKGVYEIARIGSYVVIPSSSDRLVGLVTRLHVEEHESLIKRQTHSPQIPEAWRLIDFTLVGTLMISKNGCQALVFNFERGIVNYPTIDAPVWFINEDELKAIFGVTDDKNESMKICTLGTDPNIPICLDANKIFGKHLAVLGSTGAGKSCTVASIIHNVLDKKKTLKDTDNNYLQQTGFLILDINGEYAKAFANKNNVKVKVYKIKKVEDGEQSNECLSMPYWLFNFNEICQLFTPSEQTQKPILRSVIRILKKIEKSNFSTYQSEVNNFKTTPKNFPSVDEEKFFDIDNLGEAIYSYETESGRSSRHKENMATLVERILSLTSEPSHDVIFKAKDTTLDIKTIQKLLLGLKDKNDNYTREYDVTILDLSFLSAEILTTVTNFIGRVVFSFFQNLPLQKRRSLPFILVLEEAHNYLPRQSSSEKPGIGGPYERIAKEGRKYGLGLLIASQRPGELSETALSQCNTLIVHRLVNPIDRQIIRSAVSVVDEDVLKMLPSLNTGHAIVIGEGVRIPARVAIDHLSKDKQPHSDNPIFIGKIEEGVCAETRAICTKGANKNSPPNARKRT